MMFTLNLSKTQTSSKTDLQMMTLTMSFNFWFFSVHLPYMLTAFLKGNWCMYISPPNCISSTSLSLSYLHGPPSIVKNLSLYFLLSIFVPLIILLFPIFCGYKRNNLIFMLVHLIYYSKKSLWSRNQITCWEAVEKRKPFYTSCENASKYKFYGN